MTIVYSENGLMRGFRGYNIEALLTPLSNLVQYARGSIYQDCKNSSQE